MRGKRKDSNQAEIERELRRVGAEVIDCTVAPQLGFDLLVAFRGQLFVVEVKDGTKPVSARQLTDGESKRREQLEYKGVPYNVIENTEQALQLIGAIR